MAHVRLNPQFEKTDDKTRYLYTQEERSPYIVTFNTQHQLVNKEGRCLAKNKYLYVVDEDDIIYCIDIDSKWNHSFFLAGGPVKAAGMFEIGFDGDVEILSNESGHYTPTTEQMLPVLGSFLRYIDPIYEAHDQALKKIIRSYRMSDLLNLYDDRLSEELPVTEEDLIAYSFEAKQVQSPSAQDIMDGYDEKLTVGVSVAEDEEVLLESPKVRQAKPQRVNMEGYDEILTDSGLYKPYFSRYGLAPKAAPSQDLLPPPASLKEVCLVPALGFFAPIEGESMGLGVVIGMDEANTSISLDM